MAKLNTQQETWNGLLRNTGIWTGVFNEGQISYASGQFVITLTAGLTNYCGFDSTPTASLVDSSYSMQCVSAGNQALTSLEVNPLQLFLDGNNGIFYLISGNVLYAKKKIATTITTQASIAYDAVAMQYLRIRELNNTVYWDYSPDGIAWTNLASIAVGSLFAITSLYMEPTAGTWAAEGSTTTVTFDNFNYTPTNKPGNVGRALKAGDGGSISGGAK